MREIIVMFMLLIFCASCSPPSVPAGSRAVGPSGTGEITVPSAQRQAMCASNKECPEDSYWAFTEGPCQPQGKCRPRPQVCPQNWKPVCGCDNRTYSNACMAHSAGVSVRYNGECR